MAREYWYALQALHGKVVFRISGNAIEEELQNTFSLSVSPISPKIPLWFPHVSPMIPQVFLRGPGWFPVGSHFRFYAQ